MTAPCGMSCFNCKMLQAKDDLDLRKKAAEKFNLEFDEAYCEGGCRGLDGKGSITGLDKACALYKCTKEKNVTFCYECGDFPCEHLHPYSKNSIRMMHNLKIFNLCLIKEMGLEEWATQKSTRFLNEYCTRKWVLE